MIIGLTPFKTQHLNNFLVLDHVILATAWENVAMKHTHQYVTHATLFFESFCHPARSRNHASNTSLDNVEALSTSSPSHSSPFTMI